MFRYLAILVEGLEKEVRFLKATKELEKQELNGTVPAYHKQLSESSIFDSSRKNIEPRKSFSDLVKASSLDNISNEGVEHYNCLGDDLMDFDTYPAKEKKSTKLSKAKSSEAISALEKSSSCSPQVKKSNMKYDVWKKYSPQTSKKKLAKNSCKNESESKLPPSQSAPIIFSRLSSNSVTVDFPTLHHIYRKDIENFLNQPTV